MIQDPIPGTVSGYRRMAFSRAVQAACDPRRGALGATRSATITEALEALENARAAISDLASSDVVKAVMEHNPDIVQMVDKGSDTGAQSFLAYLPLNETGARALLTGKFDSADPDLFHLCQSGVRPHAIYIWLVYAPRYFVATLKALDGYLGSLAPQACPLFARTANHKAAAMFIRMGFERAADTYAQADDDMLALAPATGFPSLLGNAAKAPPPAPQVRVARTMDDLLKSFSIRSATYIAQQSCPFEEEFDGNDFCATHLIGEIDGEPAGSIRVRFFADFVKIERLAVRQEYRTSKLAFRLVREALLYARRKGYRRAYGHSRTDLTRFWGLFGFRPLADRQAFTFSDVEYVELEAQLPATDDIVSIGADPYILIRPEGEWDHPGPLDRSAARTALRRSA